MKTRILSTLAAATLAILPVIAQADVTIVNNADANATVEVPHYPTCTGPNPNGIIYKKTFKTLPDVMVNRICKNHETACVAFVYMSEDCSGAAIAKVTLNIPANNINVENYGIDGYTVAASGNTVIIEKPSFLKRLFSF